MLYLPHTQALCATSLDSTHSISLCSNHPRLPVLRSRNSFSPRINFSWLIKLDVSDNKQGQRYVTRAALGRSISFRDDEDEEGGGEESCFDRSLSSTFEAAVKLFNDKEYYACHDLLESLWFESYDPLRTLFHALLQCSVAFYHLFNQNHKGAMMEMGEGVCKLRKLNITSGPFYQFEQEISTVLNFIYQTQLELAACNEDFCLTMEQTEITYQLLEGFGAGQHLYYLEQINIEGHNNDIITYIVFDPQISYGATNLPSTRVKLPNLKATRNHLKACD